MSLWEEEPLSFLTADSWLLSWEILLLQEQWVLGRIQTSAEVTQGEEAETELLMMLSLVLDLIAYCDSNSYY